MNTQHLTIEPPGGTTVYVYGPVVRLWHWVNVLCILTLATTGLLIASPLSSVSGEASANFLTGYIRFAHFSAGYVFAVAFILRIYAAFTGNEHARSLFIVPINSREWRSGLLHQIRWYLFLDRVPRKFVGHNPLAQLMMFLFVFATLFMIVTGFALYSEGKGVGGWHDRVFGWVIPLFGGSQAVHSWHHLAMWMVISFVIVHVYAAIREEILSRQTMLSAIISGTRTFRD